MTGTAHAVVAAVLATKIQNPAVLAGVNLGMHFLLDLVPHWDSATHFKTKSKERLFVEALMDFGVSLILAYIIYTYLGGNNLWLLYVGVFASQLPDFFSAAYVILNIKFFLFEWFFKFQYRMHWMMDAPWGIVTQVFVVGVIVGLVVRFL